MPWVPVHTSGLAYSFYSGGVDEAAYMDGSTVYLDDGYPNSVTIDGKEVHWFIEFDAGQGNIQFRITVQAPPFPESINSETALHSIDASTAVHMAHQAGGVYEGLAAPFGEFHTPVIGFYAGSGEKLDPSEYLVEVFIGGSDRPSLVKDSERVLISPAVPAQAGAAPIPFHMYATPLPLGWKYKPYTTDGVTLLPNSSASFWDWPWQIYKPRIFTAPPESVTYQYMTVEAFLAYLSELGVSSVEFDQATAVYDAEGNVKGFMVWVVTAGEPVQAPPQWWPPLDYMTFVTFPDVATDGPYGYPVGEGMFRGYFDVPTVDGVTRVWGNYWKDHNGVLLWLPAQSDPLPPYCSYRDSVQYNPARVVVLADFPGRAAVPGRPAVYAQDGKAGWNAGATSVDAFSGDCRVTFTPSVTAAVALGLTKFPRPNVVDPNQLDFAFRFDQPNGGSVRVCITERGQRIGPYFTASANAVFTIERVGGSVTYKVDGVERHTAATLNFQTLCVGACLYYGGDGVY